jgi:Domain of unknown function (DUF4437)
MFKKLKSILFVSSSIALLSSFSLFAAEDNLPPGVKLMKLDELKWVPSAGGREQAFLLGNPKESGPYIYFVKWPAFDKALAHSHPDTRYGMVVQGLHYIGYGDKYDESKLHAHPVGTFFVEPANTAHFGKTDKEGTILYFFGTGPSGIKPLE